MKRFCIFVLLGLFVMTGLHAEVKLSLKVDGGLVYMANSDWNNGVTGLNDMLGDTNTNKSGAYPTLHTGWHISGEAMLQIAEHFSIGFGGSGVFMSTEGSIQYSLPGAATVQDWKLNCNVFPLLLNVHYFTPVSQTINFTASAGAGLYIGQFTFSDQYQFSIIVPGVPTISGTENFSVSKNVLGLRGSIGLELNVAKGVFITFDVSGQYASVGEITGTDTSTDGTSTTQTLWYLQTTPVNGKSYNLIKLAADAPTGYNSVRKASIDMSGFALSIGARFAL